MFTRRDLIEEPNFFNIDLILSPAFQHGTRHDVYENPATGCRDFIEEALPMLKMINLQTALPNFVKNDQSTDCAAELKMLNFRGIQNDQSTDCAAELC